MSSIKNVKILLFSFLTFFSVEAFCQTETGRIKSVKWTPFYTNEQVEVNYKYSECSLPEWGTQEESAYLQFKNLTGKKIKFTWSPTLWYGDKCYNPEGNDPEMTYTITLEPNQILEGTCSTESPRYLKIFGKYLNVIQEGTVRELKNFQITKAQIEFLDK